MLNELIAVESGRWVSRGSANGQAFHAASHGLETSALIARLPRQAVMHDLVFAQAARWWLSDESFEDKEGDEDFGAGGIDGYFAKEVTEAARILSRLAWSPWLARIDLRWRLRELRIRTAKCDAPEVRRALRNAQHTYGELPRPLGQLVTKT